jgi:protein-L-isoaspartate O-methyltransferase
MSPNVEDRRRLVEGSMTAAEHANRLLVEQLIGRGALWSPALIDAFRATPRHCFLQRVYHFQRDRDDPNRGAWRELATTNPGRAELRLLYADRALTTRLSEPAAGRPALPISSSSQPSLMAQMLEDLRLAPGMRVLEVGTGTGFNAALLAHVVGRLVSMDVDGAILAEAAENLRAFPDRAVELRHGDGRQGWPPEAPYDRILVTAATPHIEWAWVEQLAPGGVLEAPLDLAPGVAYLVRGGRLALDGGWCFEGHLTRPAYFMPLRAEGEAGFPTSGPAALLPHPDRLRPTRAPWAAWMGRATTTGGQRLLPALVFLAWLEGLTVVAQTLADRSTWFGIADLIRGHACWMGEQEWRISGPAGKALAARLWQRFFDLGGPWPTEFRLRAWPSGTRRPESVAGGVAYRHPGHHGQQLWELLEPRERLPGS